ncbi:hypothetical protein [Synoicihabitans lomoniglobus]|uniref:DUF455 family protein n=1 Tax=Synoicihabitans lomoniglobus TaxID=2909285 RepID=A0AAF0CM68_9BACT|nr:hypothetical protein [Opitutaceae bacterium LMO-M01]WED63693.1 hypothetical protein PXH66_15260 [Opitutaceae bacterium LMO-M01]
MSATIDIDANRTLLNRYRFVLHGTMHTLAGWLPQSATFELKCELGRAIWECAQHVNALYLRLREIQSPAFQPPPDEALVHLMAELPHAPDEFGIALAWQDVIVPDLIRALEHHENATFPNSDQPSVYAAHHILLDLRDQQKRLHLVIETARAEGRIKADAETWRDYVQVLLDAAGGVSGNGSRAVTPTSAPACRHAFETPREARRDERFTRPGADEELMPDEADYDRHTVEEFERYSTEMLAAETVAVVMHSFPRMPWGFQFDSARHLYDEVRHCLMGFEWMRQRGFDPFNSPQYLHIFTWRTQFPPVMQYCLLTMGNEVHAFPYRHRRVEEHKKTGDALSEQFVRYDIADETQHVRFGKRWLPEMLKHVGEPKSTDDYVAATISVWENEYKTGKLSLNVE